MNELKAVKDKVTFDVAEKEVNKWLDSKKISVKRREALAENIEKLIDCVMTGELVLTDQNDWIHNLLFETAGQKQLTYKNRLKGDDIQRKISGLKSADSSAIVNAYICALSDQPAAIVGALDTEDLGVARSVVIFFMRG